MKNLPRYLLTLSMFLTGFALWAADVWVAKPYTEWSDKDIQKIMSDSPWAKKVTATFEFSARGGGPAASGGGGGGGGGRGKSGPQGDSIDPGTDGGGTPGIAETGGGGGRGGRGGGGGGGGGAAPGVGGPPETELEVRWMTAPTVQQAVAKAKYGAEVATSPDAKKQLETEQTFYAISISNLPVFVRPRTEDDAKALAMITTLTVKGKDPITAGGVLFPDQAQGQGRGARSTSATFVFPKTTPLTADDKEVEFSTKFGKTKVQAKFDLKKMVVNGKLGL